MSDKTNALLEQVLKAKARHEFDMTPRQHDYVNAYMYYTGDLPRPYDIGLPPKGGKRQSRAAFVENLVAEAERKLTPALLSIFTEDDNEAVRFYGTGFRRDPEVDRLVNTEINQIFLHRNDGKFHLENAIKEALITGNGFMKVFVEEHKLNDKMPLNDWTRIEDVIAQLSQNIDEDGSQWHLEIPPALLKQQKKGKYKSLEWRTRKDVMAQTPDGQTIEAPFIEIKGVAALTKTKKDIREEQIDFKDLIFDTSCGSDFDKCRYICHRRIITVGEAIEMGFDATLLESAGLEDSLSETALSKRDLLPMGEFGANYQVDNSSSDPMERKITVYESYIYSSIPTGKTAYYQVNHTSTEILDYKPVAGNPFVNGRVNIMPGSVWGTGLYDSLKHYQDIMSDFARVATQKAIAAAFPSYEAVKGQYDRESLLNRHRPGAVVEVMAPGVINLVPEPQMPQEFYSMMQFFKNSYESKTSTSVGALSGEDGMVENVSSQTVGMMLANEAQKDKIYGKALARTLVRPLFEKIYQIMKSEGIKIYAENGVITADQLPESWTFTIDVNTSNDKFMKAKQLASAYTTLAQVAATNCPVISPSNLVAAGGVLLDGSELDTNQFFTDPNAGITPEMIAQQQKESDDDKALAHNAKLLAYQTAIAQYQKTLAEIAKLEASTDEHIKDGHAKREIEMNRSLLEASKANINASDKAATHAYNQRKADIEERFANQEVILKTAELHQKGSTNTDINGVNVR